ncbi:hypothetical protein HYH03_011577 [Edaphochlamys debaryana]|uniref:Uncharacterized protein n=1 Tax=Edaphochlamys debaryana TaxID=47281 RepID=A0A835XTQ5_9CHLO|nr:hypothetical protein HYH03_011577 [Edaphochlamys debaryana]|eukprot:KAG2489946.1 hypothetical protein HYH03_011577 [Edaphochlamys debaryana]
MCPAGTYSATGYYPASSTPEASCTPCPAGTFSAAVGASSVDTCVECPIRFWSPAGAPSCIDCGAGKTTVWKGSDDTGDCVDAAFDIAAWNEGPWALSDTWFKDRAFDTAARFIWSSPPASTPTEQAKIDQEIAVLTRQFEAQSGVTLELYIMADNAAEIFIDGVFLGTSYAGWTATGRPLQVYPLPALTTGLHTVKLRGLNSQINPADDNPAGLIAGIRTVATQSTVIVTDSTWTRAAATAPDAADLAPSSTPPKGFSTGIYGASYGWFIWTDTWSEGESSAPVDVINVFKASYTTTETVGDVEIYALDSVCELFVNGLFIGAQTYSEYRWNGIALSGGENTFVLRCTNPIYCDGGATGACVHDPSSPANPAWVAFRFVLGGVDRMYSSNWEVGSAETSPCNNDGHCSAWSALSYA